MQENLLLNICRLEAWASWNDLSRSHEELQWIHKCCDLQCDNSVPVIYCFTSFRLYWYFCVPLRILWTVHIGVVILGVKFVLQKINIYKKDTFTENPENLKGENIYDPDIGIFCWCSDKRWNLLCLTQYFFYWRLTCVWQKPLWETGNCFRLSAASLRKMLELTMPVYIVRRRTVNCQGNGRKILTCLKVLSIIFLEREKSRKTVAQTKSWERLEP